MKVKVATHDKRSKTGYKTYEKEVHKVQILDPATGTGTFLAEVVKFIYNKNFKAMKGMWSSYVENDLIPRLNGFELLMASYAMAHLKLDLLLRETGYNPKAKTDATAQRFKIFLTNSLEPGLNEVPNLFMAKWLTDESAQASQIKEDAPVMVILGNPPYSGESANKGKWIMDLMTDYKKEPGGKEKLKERNPKWINDDYVKFMRYGQHFIEKNGEGILAFINPHGFLDNPTFRGMRWNLLKTYDKIYTIDLHGNSKKKETAPDGSVDQNVFDIMQGVSINILVKTGNKKPKELGQVLHYDLYGKRDLKYDFLKNNGLKTINFVPLPNKAPMYFMVQKDFEAEEEYNKGFSVNKLFTVNNVGIVTSRDGFVIDKNKEVIENRIKAFFELDKNQLLQDYNLRENKSWKIDAVKLKAKTFDKSSIQAVSYRPFDNRYLYYNSDFIERSRNEVMQHFANGENIGLIIGRQGQVVGSMQWNLSFITNKITDFNLYYRGGGATFPLYLYKEKNALFTESKRKPNLNEKIVSKIAKGLGLTFTPEKVSDASEASDTSKRTRFAPIDILDYIYAVLHSPTYRETYKEFLKIDFPRVPFPTKENFWDLVKLGGELRQLHLLESDAVEEYITGYPEDGDNIVTRKMTKTSKGYVPTNETHGNVWINDEQYFENVPLIAWEFYIGGYQPAQKWLKDRRDRELSFDDILHYQKMIVALTETDRLMKEIDLVMNAE
jgi:predicted helicase